MNIIESRGSQAGVPGPPGVRESLLGGVLKMNYN